MRGYGALAWAAGLVAALACRPGAPSSPVSELPEPLVALMADEVRAAREAGAGSPALALAGAGIPGDSLGEFVSIATGSCALILARGGAGVQDLDVFAFSDDGTVLASDESDAKDAEVLFCPTRGERTFVSARIAAGFGLFGVTAQLVAAEHARALGQDFDAVPRGPSELLELGSNWPGLDERLLRHRRRLGGHWESLRKVALPLDPRLYVNVSTRVDAHTCLDLMLLPSEEVMHVDLEVVDANGRWVGSGAARGADRSLRVCSDETRELTVRSRPHAGRGLGALVISRASMQSLADTQDSARVNLRSAGSLPELRTALRERLDPHYGRPVLTRTGELALERGASLGIPLSAGCSRLDVVTAAPVSSVQARLWDVDGRLLSRDEGDTTATLFACGVATAARLDLEALLPGQFAVEVRHGTNMPELARTHPLGTGRLLRALHAAGRLPSLRRLPQLHAAPVSDTELVRVDVPLPEARCVAFHAALDRGATGLEVRLFEPDVAGESAAFEDAQVGYGRTTAEARLCSLRPPRDRQLRAELRAHAGSATVLWTSQVFDPATPDASARAR